MLAHQTGQVEYDVPLPTPFLPSSPLPAILIPYFDVKGMSHFKA